MRRGVGAYLARSGTAYLFQIRLPKDLGGGRGVRPGGSLLATLADLDRR